MPLALAVLDHHAVAGLAVVLDQFDDRRSHLLGLDQLHLVDEWLEPIRRGGAIAGLGQERVNWATPALVALYTGSWKRGSHAAIEAVLTMLPPRPRMCSSARRVPSTTPVRLMSITWRRRANELSGQAG